MAQSKDKRRQRSKRTPSQPAGPSPQVIAARQRRRRLVVAFLIVVGLAGILAISGSGDGGDGAPAQTREG